MIRNLYKHTDSLLALKPATTLTPGAQLGNFKGGGAGIIIGRIILYIALVQVSNVLRLCLERRPKPKCEMQEGVRAQSAPPQLRP